jgi:ADP-ribose pyrophosphatase YjhB (NUDIX family)
MLCFNENGQVIDVPGEPAGIRPAVYGILIENEQVLLQPHPKSGLWQPPGKVLDPDEAPGSAVRRCFQTAAGILPLITGLLLTEDGYWLDEAGKVWWLSVLYYALKRPTAGVAGLIDFDNPARPEWFPLENLSREKMQFGYEAVQAGRMRTEFMPAIGKQ